MQWRESDDGRADDKLSRYPTYIPGYCRRRAQSNPACVTPIAKVASDSDADGPLRRHLAKS